MTCSLWLSTLELRLPGMPSRDTTPTRETPCRSVRSAGTRERTASSTLRPYRPCCWPPMASVTASATTPSTTTSTLCRRRNGRSGSTSRTSKWGSTTKRFECGMFLCLLYIYKTYTSQGKCWHLELGMGSDTFQSRKRGCPLYMVSIVVIVNSFLFKIHLTYFNKTWH